jgi:putative PEP-CTERM system histidine kinase
MEDADLLKIIADHTAGSLLNLKLSQRIQQYRAMEAYQTMSTFMVHDLKNLASTLSLTMQNLPIHFENPEFRSDALRVIQQTMTRINTMCGRLSLLSQKIELKRGEGDINEIVNSVLCCLDGSQKGRVVRDLRPLPTFLFDSEQMQKVITNLILNANEATEDGAEILISTGQKDGWVTLSVRDSGCGMTKEFMERSLFTPFKTTKKNGMGIGLFHSKMIVEAHGGRIEVESEPGSGTTFRVMLPIKKE